MRISKLEGVSVDDQFPVRDSVYGEVQIEHTGTYRGEGDGRSVYIMGVGLRSWHREFMGLNPPPPLTDRQN